MKHKKIFVLIALILIFLLAGCGNAGKSDTKTIKVSQFTDLIFDGTDLLPNTDFAWNMSRDDFLSKVYRADVLDPGSETFNEYRYSHSKETNITTYTPMIACVVDGIPGEGEAAFAFNEEGLFRTGYVWIYKEDETNNAEKALACLMDNLNTSEYTLENQFEIPDLSNAETADFPYEYQWLPADSSQGYIELGVLKLKGHTIVQVTVGI